MLRPADGSTTVRRAAAAHSGLWDLAEVLESRDAAKSERYRDAALSILDSLCTDAYVAWTTPGWQGILKHGVYHFHKNLGVDESVMWGDFFFLEAVDKVLCGLGIRPGELKYEQALSLTSRS